VHYALRNKARKRVRDALEHPKRTYPFPFYAIHSDSVSEFPNSAIVKRAEENNIRFSKGRTGKKNSNCYAGQKNKFAVRDIAGYCRYSGERGTTALQAVCNACGLLPSLFYPCMKLVSKERAGSKYRKRRDAAKPPYQRLIEREDVPRDRKPAVIDLKTSASLMERKFLPDAAIDNLTAETFSAVT
jgi:hypothetical protein